MPNNLPSRSQPPQVSLMYPGHPDHEPDDSPEQAAESGEPAVAGRSHGHILEPDPPTILSEAADDEHWDSGRHKA